MTRQSSNRTARLTAISVAGPRDSFLREVPSRLGGGLLGRTVGSRHCWVLVSVTYQAKVKQKQPVRSQETLLSRSGAEAAAGCVGWALRVARVAWSFGVFVPFCVGAAALLSAVTNF